MPIELFLPIVVIGSVLVGAAGARAVDRRRRREIVRRVVRFGDRIPPLRAANDNRGSTLTRLLGIWAGSGRTRDPSQADG
jgi:hypothetical protein